MGFDIDLSLQNKLVINAKILNIPRENIIIYFWNKSCTNVLYCNDYGAVNGHCIQI